MNITYEGNNMPCQLETLEQLEGRLKMIEDTIKKLNAQKVGVLVRINELKHVRK